GVLESQKGELLSSQANLDVKKADLASQQATKQSEKDAIVEQKKEAEEEAARVAEQERLAEQARKAAAEAEEAKAAEEATTSESVSTPASETRTTTPSSSTNTPQSTNTPTSSTSGGNNGGSTSNGGGQTTTPSVEEPAKPSVPAPSPSGGSVTSIAMKYIGVPYVWGGKTPNGFDCSGFVAYVYNEATGANFPSYTVSLEAMGSVIPVSQAQAGDLFFWGSRGASHHVALALGGGSYIHAPQPGQSVTTQTVSNWAPDFAVRIN